MPPMYPIWPNGAGMFIDLTARKLGPEELRDALTRAVSHKDTAAVRNLFDHAFWHKTPFKPDWFHLYIAVETENRDMVKLLTARGATWTDDQARVAKLALGAKCDVFKVILRGAGIRTDYSAAELANIAPLAALEMNKRILAENRKAGHDVSAEEKKFSRSVHVAAANAVLENDMPRARRALHLHPDANNPTGHDVSEIFASVLGGFLNSSTKRALTFIDRLQAAGVKLQPVDLTKVSFLTLPQHYDLLPELDRRGLLPDDLRKLRNDMVDTWSYLQDVIDLDGYILRIPENILAEKQTQFRKAAETLCTPDSKLDEQDVDYFLRQHRSRMSIAPKALAHMDRTLIETGFFNNPAFTAKDLRTLADTPALDTGIAATFNKLAARRDISGHGIGFFLNKKRFHVLENALAQGAVVPDRIETEAIVDYLATRVRREVPSAEIIQSLRVLKETGADFGRVRSRDYLGTTKPGMAKALLDLDLIGPRDINSVKLRKRCGPPVNVINTMDATDRHYAMRQFAYQVELEKTDPEQYKPYRDQPDAPYQKLYFLHQLKQIGRRTGPVPRTAPPRAMPASQQEKLQRIIADNRRRARENTEQREHINKILRDARNRTLQESARDRAQLHRILEQHRLSKEAEKEKMRQLVQDSLKRRHGKDRFGY